MSYLKSSYWCLFVFCSSTILSFCLFTSSRRSETIFSSFWLTELVASTTGLDLFCRVIFWICFPRGCCWVIWLESRVFQMFSWSSSSWAPVETVHRALPRERIFYGFSLLYCPMFLATITIMHVEGREGSGGVAALNHVPSPTGGSRVGRRGRSLIYDTRECSWWDTM